MLRCVRAKLPCRCGRTRRRFRARLWAASGASGRSRTATAHETPVSRAALGLQHVRVGPKVLFRQEAHFAIRFRVLNRFVEGFQTYPESRRQLPELQVRHIA